MKKDKQQYRRYVRELESLKEGGCTLYFPENTKISPKKMAHLMVRDTGGCYMRDPSFDEKGRVIQIQFYRVREIH